MVAGTLASRSAAATRSRSLRTEGATITALVEGDLAAARKARIGADAILHGLEFAA